MNAVETSIVMRFALEPYSEKLVQEMRPLWDDHAAEVGQKEFDPNLTLYSSSQKNGMLRIFTARVGGIAGEAHSMLVGYQVFFVMNHPHRKNCLEACQDVLYLDPDVRKGYVGIKFLKWCDMQLVKEGVQMIMHQIRAQNNFGKIFERMGYELFDLTYAKKIGGV